MVIKNRGVAQLVARLLWAKTAKRARWAKKRAGFGAAVKNFKAYAAEIFGNRKRADKAERRHRKIYNRIFIEV